MVHAGVGEVVVGAGVDGTCEALRQAVAQGVAQLLPQCLLHVVGLHVGSAVQAVAVQRGTLPHVRHAYWPMGAP